VATWNEFRRAEAELAEAGERLLSPNGEGVAFLATLRKDGGPRLHPVMPVLANGTLHVFVVRLSPKYEDLVRDGRYALHAMLPQAGGEEFYLTGHARPVDDRQQRAAVTAATGGRLGGHAPADADPHLVQQIRDRLGEEELERLFELDVHHVLYTHWDNCGTGKASWPRYRHWHAS
jgi:hypothetical protein